MAGNYAQLLDIINNPTQHGLPAWDNNAKQIEGETIQQYLLYLIQSLTVGYQFMGVASTNTSGGTPDQNVFYIAGAGTYNGFGSNPITIDAGYIGIIKWNGVWSLGSIKIADAITFEDVESIAIKLYGFLYNSDSNAWNNMQNGDIAFNLDSKLLRKKVSSSTYSTIPFRNGAIYTYKGAFYYYDGETLRSLDNELDTSSFIVQREFEWNKDEFVTLSGVITTQGGFQRTNPILLKKGQTIMVKTRDYDFCVVAKCNELGANIQTLIKAERQGTTNALQYFQYTTLEDIYIIVSVNRIYEYGATVVDMSQCIQAITTKINVSLEDGYYLGGSGQPYFNPSDYFDYKRSILPIKTNGAKRVALSSPNITRIIEYDATGSRINSITSVDGIFPDLDDNCAYINFNTTDLTLKSVEVTLFGFSNKPYLCAKKLRVGNDLLAIELGNGIYTTLNLFLPTIYSVEGNSIPMVVYMPPDGGYSNMLNGITLGNDELVGVNYLNNEGIAFVSIYGWSSYYGIDRPNAGITSPFPTPIVLEVYEKVLKYITQYFNIDANSLLAMCYSGGGKLAEYYAIRNKIFKSIIMCNPTLSLGYAGKSSAQFYDWRCILVDQYDMKNVPTGFTAQQDFNMTSETFIDWVKNNFDVWGSASPNYINTLLDASQKVDILNANAIAWKTYQEEVGGAYPEEGYMIDGQLVKIYNNLDAVKFGNGTPTFFILCKGDGQAPWQASNELSSNLRNGGQESKCIFIEGSHDTPIKDQKKNVTPLYSETEVSVPFAWRYVAYIYFMKCNKRTLIATEFGDDIITE